MSLTTRLQAEVANAISALYGETVAPNNISINETPSDFNGQLTVLIFPFTKFSKLKPEETGEVLGKWLLENCDMGISDFNIVKGFLNISLLPSVWISRVYEILGEGETYGKGAPSGKTIVLEYSSPNTNKPLHLGHIRNNLLGYATARILEYAGNKVVKTQVINDRGIHICKSMLAWKLFANGETPESSGMKGDHLVGKYYVKFESAFREEYEGFQYTDMGIAVFEQNKKEGQDFETFFKDYKNTYFNKFSELGIAAQKMLEDWENNDAEVRQLWKMMNGWVLEGMEKTYQRLGVAFDRNYFESETYMLGKDMVQKGLSDGVFYQKEDNSVWIDLTDKKLDQKLVLRGNGTSVYITQDIGLASMRYEDYKMDSMIYVVGDEQDYHFKVLFEILKRLGEPYSNDLHHLSYGMVELTTGKMKSREGTIVDADDLITEILTEVEEESKQRDTLDELDNAARLDIYRRIGMAALKFFILRVEPRKRMVFDPKESIDLKGFTGPYIQNAYVRTQAVIRKAGKVEEVAGYGSLEPSEQQIAILLEKFPAIVALAANRHSPAEVANYCYELAKAYHSFWGEVSILKSSPDALYYRLAMSKAVASVLTIGMGLLGIEMPERM